jgi:membrane protein
LRAFVREVDRSRTFGLAAELSFWLFFSLIPLVAVAGMVAAKLAVGHADTLAQALESVPAQTRDLVHNQLAQIAEWNGGAVGIKAAVVFVWLASSGVHAVFELLELKSQSQRSWYRRRLLAIATCVAMSLGVALLALLATGVASIEALVRGVLPSISSGSALARISKLVVGFGLSVSLVAALYWIGVPRDHRRTMPIVPGACLAVFVHFVLGAAYVLYLSKMGMGGAYQAGLAVIGVTLMALYIFALALLLGAQLNCTLATRTKPDED